VWAVGPHSVVAVVKTSAVGWIGRYIRHSDA